ncbi:hypothetical protein L211DRAFT_248218 [Terfezia boudieri ATCC MYA-4762]|uniref:Uncharacterized protein n=1 Tax=Terfezia boudieri ATCC MYA-4762 TaxID=1051890 RepID=A0A3N4M1L6_9PEZI|nr:hypothetical protein L211DRAFT_248218 [Terfezia boudieri ATCC MYA-4762]
MGIAHFSSRLDSYPHYLVQLAQPEPARPDFFSLTSLASLGTNKRTKILARYTVPMPAERNARARGQHLGQWRAPVRPGLSSPVRELLLGLISVISLALTVLALRFVYKGIRHVVVWLGQVVGFLFTLAIRMGLVLTSPGIFLYRKLTLVGTFWSGCNVKPTGPGVTETQPRTTTRSTTVMSSTTVTTSLVGTVTTTETSIISRLVPSITTISTTITITEQCSCPTHTPPAALLPTSSEINLSSSLFWSIYIPLVVVVIAIVGSHIYFHRAQLLEHKRLHKEIKSIKADKGKAVEVQNTKAEVVAVEKIKWYRAPPARG